MKGFSEHPRVLVVNDDADTLQLLTQALHDGFSLVLANDASRGWEIAHGDPPPDLILIDAVLPGMDGVELCYRLSSEFPALPILVTAAKPDSNLELRAIEAGCADFVAGPLLPELVRVKLQRQLARKNAASAITARPVPAAGSAAAASPAAQAGTQRVAAGASRLTDGAAEIKRLNAELERQKQALAELSGELQTFSYSVSHDLRAPLRHLVGFSNALLEDHRADLQGTALMYLDCIAKAGRKMEALVDALLTLSRVGAQDMAPTQIDLSFMVRECVMALQSADPQRPVELRVQDNLIAHGDAPLMRTALRQLLDNAFKFSGKKDRTVISFGRKEEGGGAYFISDQGAGFDMQYASRLFGPFQRLHQEGEFEGVGIGLAVVQRIIRRHGGRVWAESKPGEGATFYFTLPA